MAIKYIGKAALTVVRQKSTGSRAYVYAGQPVGDDVDHSELDRLEAEGFIAAVQVADPAVDPEAGAGGGDGQAPSPNAKKADWVEYAVARGYSREEAEKATQADLIKALG